MIAQILTPDQIRQSEGADYNSQVWSANIDRMTSKYKDVIFYQVTKDDVYPYDRYFVEYTLPEGLRLFGDFRYGGGITNGGFYRLDKDQCTADGKCTTDVLKLVEAKDLDGARALVDELTDSKIVKITYGKFYDEDSQTMCLIGTSKEARAWMTEQSVKRRMTFTKG